MFTSDLKRACETAQIAFPDGARVLVIGHTATRWALEHYLNGAALGDLVAAEFVWREGWEFVM